VSFWRDARPDARPPGGVEGELRVIEGVTEIIGG